MNSDERLAFCRKCTNRKFDPQQGIICRLTDQKADFEESCADFNLDPTVKDKSEVDHEPQTVRPSHELISEISEGSKDKFRQYQDFSSAIIGGLLVTLVGAAIWAAVTVATEYQIGYMAIGIGLLVGFGIRYFGAGVDQKFGILGGVLALVSCLLGNIFAQVGFAAQFEGITFLKAFGLIDWNLLPEILTESFSPMDLLFYGFAVYEGYRFAFRSISEEELAQMKDADFDPIPPGYKYRRIAAGVASVILVVGVFILNQPVNGEVTLTYEDGTQMSDGTYKDGKEDGNWLYFYPGDGQNVQIAATYKEGVPHGEWIFYAENGKRLNTTNFQYGVKNGLTENYYESGQISDSGRFVNKREEGMWAVFYENGQIAQTGMMVFGRQEGLWKSYHQNGQLQSEGNMKRGEQDGLWKTWKEDGTLETEINSVNGKQEFVNLWNTKGQHTIKNGNGTFKEYYESGSLHIEGQVKNKKRIGRWTTYYEDKSKQEEGDYDGDEYKTINTWNLDGSAAVVNGNGKYQSYNFDGSMLTEEGEIVNGLRDGTWYTYSSLTGSPNGRTSYKAGKLDGTQAAYNEDNTLISEGTMKDGEESGEWKWYQNGDLESQATFVNGIKTGTQTSWNILGQMVMEETYVNGERTELKLLLKDN